MSPELPDFASVDIDDTNATSEVVLNIEGTTFRLRPDDAAQIGAALVQAAEAVFEQLPLFGPEKERA